MYRKNKSELKEKQFSNFRYTSIPSANKDFEEFQVIFSYKGRDYKYFSFIKKDPNFKKEDYLKHVQQEIAEAARSGGLLKIVKAYPKKKEHKKILRKPIIVTAAIGVVAATFLGLTIWQATLYTGDYHKVTWVDENNNVLEVDRVKHGTMPEYHSELPTKPDSEIDEAGNQYRYTFDRWDKELAPVTEDIIYRAEMKAHSLVTVLEVSPAPEGGFKMDEDNQYFIYTGDLNYVDWGDGTVNQSTSHAYAREDYYTIKIYGEIERLSISSNYEKILRGGTFVTKLSYSYSIKKIGGNFFHGDNLSIKEVFIPSSVKTIESEAFYYLNSLTTITFEDGMDLEYIGSYAFCWLNNLIKIDFGYNFHASSLNYYTFQNVDSLESMIFKDGTRIDNFEYTFAGANSLKTIVFGNNCHIGELKAVDIEGPQFALVHLSFGDNCIIDSIGGTYYYGGSFASTLISFTVGNNCKIGSINDFTFANCTTLSFVSFGDNCEIELIGDFAFYSCSSLTSVIFGENCKIGQIGDYAFCYCSSLVNFTLPDSTYGLESIGVEAFEDCGIVSFNMPDSVTSIGTYSFYGCNSLRSIKLSSNLEIIPYCAFTSCSSLTSIRIPRSVKTIQSYAFENCESLTSLTFESDSELETIESEAFVFDQTISHRITDLSLPEGLKFIGDNAFFAWKTLKTLTLPNSLEYIGPAAFELCYSLKTINWPKESKINYIGADAFYGIGLENLEVPASVKTIAERAFSGDDDKAVPGIIKHLKLHNNVDFIGSETFSFHQLSIVDLTEFDHVPLCDGDSLATAFDMQDTNMMRFYVKNEEMKTKFDDELQTLTVPYEVIVGEAPTI